MVIVYIIIMSVLVSSFVLTAALLRSLFKNENRKIKSRKGNLRK